ncbi:unnamed protein product [Lepeophtheirus salmonis]|uniref:(salmon louse) hypothetical protein n=1 Tax=Lepeophtheirus salmonis TaxID=72036 RepID=A0A7R8CCM3_LEPSM|nr:unnamed protein product [Lepeophtheirus salmonis]CAF2772666.1 unnamed protein product [Lepeophtheirus salmonis]
MYGYYHQNPVSQQTTPSHEAIHLYSEEEYPVIRQRPKHPSNPSSASYLDLSSNGYVTSTPECASRRLNFTSDDSGNVSDLWSEISSPLIQLRNNWRRQSIVVLSGAVYSVQITLNSSRERGVKLSGKYASILYAHQRVYNSSRPSRIPLGVIRDESGKVLSGKRAAIQFSYNKRNVVIQDTQTDTETPPAPKVVKVEPSQSQSESNSNEITENKRKEIVKKVASFGHFATSRKTNEKEIRGVKKGGKELEDEKKGSGNDDEKKQKKRPIKKEESNLKKKRSKNENLQSKNPSLEPIDLDEIF